MTYNKYSKQERIGTITQINLEEGNYELVVDRNTGYLLCDLYDIKPILYDLSYLTKEIEHEGERFVPVIKLSCIPDFAEIKAYGYEKHFYYVKFEVEGEIVEWKVSCFTDSMSYYVIKKLLEWHFNVFNLPEVQFINKATLTNK